MTTNEARSNAKEISSNGKTVAVNVKSGEHHLYRDGKYLGKKPGWIGGHTGLSECPAVREVR